MDNQSPSPFAPYPPVPGMPASGTSPTAPQVDNSSGQAFKVPEMPAPVRSSKSKILIFAIVALLVIGGGAAGYYFYFMKPASVAVQPTPTPEVPTPTVFVDPFAGWNLFSNIYYKYTIKYPADWRVDSTDSEAPLSQRGSLFIGGDTKFTGPDTSAVSLLVFKKDPTTLLSTYDSIYSSGGNTMISVVDILMTVQGRQYELRLADGSQVVRTIFASGEYLYSFQSPLSYKTIHSQIISTFQLTQ
jgi:hypothetical protein